MRMCRTTKASEVFMTFWFQFSLKNWEFPFMTGLHLIREREELVGKLVNCYKRPLDLTGL